MERMYNRNEFGTKLYKKNHNMKNTIQINGEGVSDSEDKLRYQYRR